MIHDYVLFFHGTEAEADDGSREDPGRGQATGQQVHMRQTVPHPQDRRGQIQGELHTL